VERSRAPRVLVIEDNSSQGANFADLLELDGFEVNLAESFGRAFAEWGGGDVDAIVLDRKLPDGNADELLPRVRELLGDAPIIIVTGYADLDGAVTALRYGAEDYLTKPVDPGVLRSVVRRVVEDSRMRKELRQAREQLQLFVDSTTDAVCLLDAQGRVSQWNRAAQRMTGYEEAEILGRSFARFFSKADVASGTPERLLKTATGVEGFAEEEGWRFRKDGTQLRANSAVTALRDRDGTLRGFSYVMRDLTERHSLEEQLRQAQKMESVGRLAGGVAHDFNNLLAAIQGSSELLLDRLPEGDRSRRAAERICKAADRGAALTQQLLALSRRHPQRPEILDLNVIVGEMRDLVTRLLGEDIELSVDLASRLPRVEIDPTHIDQILMNLVVNARDAMPAGGSLEIGTERVDLAPPEAGRLELTPGHYLELRVRDSGHGMDAETLSKIFEPFFTTKSPGKGTGLGLSTVFGLVKQSHGSIAVESEPGQGTTVRVYLPAAGRQVSRRRKRPPSAPNGVRGNETVLIVEDDQLLREITCEVLGGAGYSVLCANTPGDAIRLSEACKERIDLVLSDVVMPQMNGLDLAKRLRERHPDLRLLFMSGYSQTDLEDRVALEPDTPLIPKPFSNQALTDQIREILDA
jgi:PAS domain S-box-containing protein